MLDIILQAMQYFTAHQWMPLAVLVISWLTSLASDTGKLPFNIPDRWKPVFVIVLGQVYSSLVAVQHGTPWLAAVEHGLITAFVAMGLFDVLVNAIFNGTLPKWLAWISAIDPHLVAAKNLGMLPKQPLFGKTPPANDVLPPSKAAA